MTIEEFIAAEAALPAYPGACCRMADKWFAARTGFSALASYGRDFETEDDVQEWLAEPGSIAVAVNRVMRSSGCSKTGTPRKGDVGLVVHDSKLCMAIHAGDCWVSRDDGGLIGAPLSAVWKAWRVECR